jgi:GPN-loop GTPase
MAPIYGQVVYGPPGSGKTTYCDGMQQYTRQLGREAWVINLDPANETSDVGVSGSTDDGDANSQGKRESASSRLPYETLFDVCEEAVNLSSVMAQTGLGPNGGLVYCMEYLEAHADTILQTIRSRMSDKTYLLLDLPGQVELYTHSTCVQKLLQRMVKEWDLRLTAVQLIDAHYCTDATKFLSVSLLGTTTMLRLELPTVSVLSKVDLLSRYGELPLQLEFFTECRDLDRLIPFLDNQSNSGGDAIGADLAYVDDPDYQRARQRRRQSTFYRKHAKLHQALAEVVEDFGLLSFLPLDISDAESVGRVLAKIDKCNGYIFTENSVPSYLFQCAIQSDNNTAYESIADVQERIAAPESIEDLKR